MKPVAIPRPGLSGDYRDSCVVCLQGTDTGLAFTGEAEWVIAGLVVLGVPREQADATAFPDSDPGMVPDGTVTVGVRVCQSCVDASGTKMPVGLIVTGVPNIRPVEAR